MAEVKPTQDFRQVSAVAEEDPFAPPVRIEITEAEWEMAKTSRLFGTIAPRPAPRRGYDSTLRR